MPESGIEKNFPARGIVKRGDGFQHTNAWVFGEEKDIRDRIIGCFMVVARDSAIVAEIHLKIERPEYPMFWEQLPRDVHDDIFRCYAAMFLTDLKMFSDVLNAFHANLDHGAAKIAIERLLKDITKIEDLFYKFQECCCQRPFYPIQCTELSR